MLVGGFLYIFFGARALHDGLRFAGDGNGGGDRRGTERASGGDGGGLLAALPMTSDLPTEYTIVADVALVKGLNGSGYSAGVTFQQTDGTQFTISGWIMA